MKKTIILLLLIPAILFVSGCGFIAEKISGKIAGELLGKAIGDNVDVNLDEGKVVIKNEDGKEMVIGGTEWPGGEAGKSIPVFKGGKIDYVADYGTSAMISIKDVKKDEYMAYIEKLKEKGFTQNSFYAENDGSYTYAAYKTDTHYASASFDGDGSLFISVATE